MPRKFLVNGRLPLFKNEPGYLFFRGKETAMVMVIKETTVVPGEYSTAFIPLHSFN
jgi:hypothetical protein